MKTKTLFQNIVCVLTTLLLLIGSSEAAISCYQCHSRHDGTCPATSAFDMERNAVVNCEDPRESQIPGTSCIKITRKSQDTVGSPGWQEEERRCATKADWGIAYGCRRYVTMENIEMETCYCNTDACNGASHLTSSKKVLAIGLILIPFIWRM